MSNDDEITVLGGKVRLRQPLDGFRTGLDAVMLAAACPAKDGAHILDLGCGVGAAGLCTLYRLPKAQLTGLDIQGDHVALAQENAALNDMQSRAEFLTGDVRDFQDQRFDHVICNPPYMEAGAHCASPSDKRATALGHREEDMDVNTWITAAFDCLKGQGSLTMIHRANMTDKIIQAIGKRFGGIEIIPLWPKEGVNAKRVIIRAYKHKKSPATLHAGLILHDHNGEYTPQANAILKDAHLIC